VWGEGDRDRVDGGDRKAGSQKGKRKFCLGEEGVVGQ
jgi:hypothetical protein